MKFKVGLILFAIIAVIVLTLPAIKVLRIGGEVPAIVPAPQRVQRQTGSFTLGPEARVIADQGSRQTAEYLAEQLRKSMGYDLPVVPEAEESRPGTNIVLTTHRAGPELGEEGYELSVSAKSVSIRASASAGLFYGAQSLL